MAMIQKGKYPVPYIGITQYYSKAHPALDLGWGTPSPVRRRAKPATGRPFYGASNGALDLTGTQAPCAGVHMFGRAVYNRFYTLYVRAIYSIRAPVRMGHFDSKRHAFTANITLRHHYTSYGLKPL